MEQNNPKDGQPSPVIKLLKAIGITFAVLFVLYAVLCLLFIHNLTSWHVKKISQAEKGSYAEYAFLPGIDDALERFATRGWQDVESQLETYAYKSLDELCDALPKDLRQAIRDALMTSTPTMESDVKGKEAEAYLIASDLPIVRDESDEGISYERRSYYVYKYKNGKYRFVIKNN